LAGFILGGLLFVLYRLLAPIESNLLNFIISQLLWVNVGWGVLNLIPIMPLDGGSIMRNLYHWLKNPYDERTPLKISIGFGILAVIAAVVFLRSSGLYLAMLLGWLTLNNYMTLRQGHSTDSII
jgi:membrane-associated protease RseP (regulator of RpoE activity)